MHIKSNSLLILGFVLIGLIYSGCGQSNGDEKHDVADTPNPETGLSAEELEKGIGPIKSISLGAIEAVLAEQGEQVFIMKCAACHKIDTRYVGPPLGGVTDRHAPEYIMNMILNPDQMVKEHPFAKNLLATYMTPMPDQNLTEEEARAVLEYLRTQPTTTN